MAMILGAPRLDEARAADRLFPSGWVRRRAATGAPVRSTAVLASLATLFVLIGTFEQIVAFFLCTTLVFIAAAAGAVFAVRRRGVGDAPFLTPGYPAAPALFVLLVLTVVLLVALHRPLQALAGLIIVLAGVPAQRWMAGRAPALAEGSSE
jgi:amino acid transporter